MDSLRVVFMGTPGFAVESLKALLDSKHEVVAVLTAVDKEAGRGRKVRHSDVKQCALENNLHILQPPNLKDPAFLEDLKALEADLFVVVAFRMLPKVVWDMPKLGTINLHASLLPQYRGAAPIQRCIMNGEVETGVTTFFIEEQIDTGKILLQAKVAITKDETGGSLHDKLMETGASMLATTVDQIADKATNPIDQDSAAAGVELKEAPKLFPEDCVIDWRWTAEKTRNHIRALNPFPTAWTTLYQESTEQLRTKLYDVELTNEGTSLAPGQIRSANGLLTVGTGKGNINIIELKVEGKKRMKAKDFLNGFTFDSSSKFE